MFDFVDLFAGIGGFHQALTSLGGRGVQAAEIDSRAASVYERNWALRPDGDVRALAADPGSLVRDHAVLTGGFPCQPFSKSGRQLGMQEERGTLFHDILKILQVKRPPVVMLENVRNIAGPRQRSAWQAVVSGLREAGYQVSATPCVFSPHLLPPSAGGAPQIRERVYILGVHVGGPGHDVDPIVENRPQLGWDPQDWSIARDVLLPDPAPAQRQRYAVTDDEACWIETWNELLARLGRHAKIPGHPLWEQAWTCRRHDESEMPLWKQRFMAQNRAFYAEHREVVTAWRRANPQIRSFPASRRKLEWQAQDSERDLWRLLLHLRPSGIRAKRPTYTPALVAMAQTPLHGPSRRRLTPAEAGRLQGFDPSFSFGAQTDAVSYKQLGNAVNVGAAAYVLGRFVAHNAALISRDPSGRGAALVESVRLNSPCAYDETSEQVRSA